MRFTRHCVSLLLGSPAAQSRESKTVRWRCGCAGTFQADAVDVRLCAEHLQAFIPIHPPKRKNALLHAPFFGCNGETQHVARETVDAST